MVRVRTVAGETFEVEAALDVTIEDVILRISALKSQSPEAISIIFKGRVLQNAQTLREAGLSSDDDTVVCVVSKASKRTLEDKVPPISQPQQPLQSFQSASASSASAVAAAAGSSASSSSSSTAAAAVAAVDNLTRMGFDEEAVQQAVRVSAGNEAAALEMLLGEPQPDRLNQAFFIRYHPQFLQLREAVRTGTASIREVVSRLAATTPELAVIAEEAPNELMRILLMPDSSYIDRVGSAFGLDTQGPAPQPAMAVESGPELQDSDYEVIDRLASMGFPREAVVQAYLACDKNEEMAVNLLLGGF